MWLVFGEFMRKTKRCDDSARFFNSIAAPPHNPILFQCQVPASIALGCDISSRITRMSARGMAIAIPVIHSQCPRRSAIEGSN
jgi:hypothetical protein